MKRMASISLFELFCCSFKIKRACRMNGTERREKKAITHSPAIARASQITASAACFRYEKHVMKKKKNDSRARAPGAIQSLKGCQRRRCDVKKSKRKKREKKKKHGEKQMTKRVILRGPCPVWQRSSDWMKKNSNESKSRNSMGTLWIAFFSFRFRVFFFFFYYIQPTERGTTLPSLPLHSSDYANDPFAIGVPRPVPPKWPHDREWRSQGSRSFFPCGNAERRIT